MKLFLVVGTASAYLADYFPGSYPETGPINGSDRTEGERSYEKGATCDEADMPMVYGGGWSCDKSNCQMQCNVAGDENATVKCNHGNWFGMGNMDTCLVDSGVKCDVDQLATVDHGHWSCEGDECVLNCEHGDALNSQGAQITTTCDNGTWWVNQIEPECPAPNTLTGRASKKAKKCKESALPAVAGGKWKCDKKTSHCDLDCDLGKDGYCLVKCNGGKWEINGKLECKIKDKDDGKKKKKKKNKDKGKPDNKPPGIPKCDNIPKPWLASGGSWNCMEMNGYYGCVLMCGGKKSYPEKNIVCKCAHNCKSNYKTYGWFGNAPTMECPKPEPTCKVQDLNYVKNGVWICNGDTCNLKCDSQYQGEATMQCKKGNWQCNTHKPKCKEIPEIDHPVGIPGHMCPGVKQPSVDKAYWTCKDMPQGPTCWLKCLNGHKPLNMYGDWVAVMCKNNGWWANDPCIGEMCPEPEPKPEKPDKPNKPKPDGPKCKQSRLPNVKNGYWQCNKNQACTLYCENGNKTTHKLVCKYGDWRQKNGTGKCSCPKGGKPIGKPDKPNKPKPKPEPENPWKPDKSCKENALPSGTDGKWHCEVFDGMYGCVLMCGGKKSTITAVCRDSQWWGNHPSPVCPKDNKVCDQYDLPYVHGGSWVCELDECVFECDASGSKGKMYASCGKKGTWNIKDRVKECKMNNPNKPKPPSNSGGSCNQNKAPHVDGGYWECKKGHCSLKCHSGKPKSGKCSLYCKKGKWEVEGDPRCKGADTTSKKNKNPTYSSPSEDTCPKFYEIPNGWMECHQGSEPVECMLMCDKGYTADVDYFSQVFADCQGGNMYPPGPTGKGSKWKCVKGYCDHNKWKRVCYDHPMNKGQPKPKGH